MGVIHLINSIFKATSFSLFACLLLAASPAIGQENLLVNGDFSADIDEQRGEPPGWHVKISSVIAVPEYEDPENKKGRTGKTRYRCGCGEFWPGAVRPWTQLRCPNCDHINVGVGDTGHLYFDNHQRVRVIERGGGHVLAMKVKAPGTRAISHLIEAERGAGYELSFRAIASEAATRVFVEGFRKVDDADAEAWLEQLPEKANPFEQTVRLKRVFRRQINPGSPKRWTRFSDVLFAPKQRYQFDYMFVSLYAYGSTGEAGFANVKLRKLTPRELQRYQRESGD